MQGDMKVPRNHWNQLTAEDQATFRQLHLHFLQQQKEHMKDRKTSFFFNDILCLMKFIDYTVLRRDDRAICTGLAFSGPFACVNTQQLKVILGRCKSSINNSFQQIGYDAVKNKTKSREAVLAIIPSLIAEQNTLRKWTVRCVSETATCCFLSYYHAPQLPFITDEDLYDEKKSVQGSMILFNQSQNHHQHMLQQQQHQFAQQNQQIGPIQINQMNFMRMPHLQMNMMPNIQQIGQMQQTGFSQLPLNQIRPTNFPQQIQNQMHTGFNQNLQMGQMAVLPTMNFNTKANQMPQQMSVLPPMDFSQQMPPPPPTQQQQIPQAQNQDAQQDRQQNKLSVNQKKKNNTFAFSFLSDEEMTVPDITPSFSTNYLDYFNDEDDDLNFEDSIFNPSRSNANNNITRSQSWFTHNFDD